jgi:hypothetical protein
MKDLDRKVLALIPLNVDGFLFHWCSDAMMEIPCA